MTSQFGLKLRPVLLNDLVLLPTSTPYINLLSTPRVRGDYVLVRTARRCLAEILDLRFFRLSLSPLCAVIPEAVLSDSGT
jgi:hypothetical protein